VRTSPVAIYSVDLQRRVLSWNRAAEEMFGWPAEQVLGEPLPIVPGENAEKHQRLWERVMAGESFSDVELVRQRRDGSRIEISLSGAPIRDAADQIVAAMAIAVDIGARKRAERELTERNEFIQTILDHLPIGLAVNYIDEGDATYINEQFATIYGWPAEELRNIETFFEKVYPDPEYRARLKEQILTGIQSGDPERMRWSDIKATTRDGQERVISARNIPLFEQNLMVSTVWDTTELVQQQEQLLELERRYQQAQKMETLGRLAGGVAHDFNNLLTVINTYSAFGISDLRPGDPLRSDLEEIQAAGDRAAALTRQLLAFSREQQLELRILDLNEIVQEMERMLQRVIGEDLGLVTRLAPDLGSVLADPGQMEQVLMNLVVNARDAMTRGGRLTIETANEDLDEAHASRHPEATSGPHVRLSVRDTGVGMSPEVRERLFEPFFTTKEKDRGTGLGLATVYGIVKQSVGHLQVDTSPGAGSAFHVYLPRRTAHAQASHAVKRSDDRQSLGGHETLLVVEDEGVVLRLTERILSAAGYQVISASNAGEALLRLEKHVGQLDLVLSDVVMPVMNGPELAARLREVRPGLPVLYMTGYSGDSAVVDDPTARLDGPCLRKPFSRDALLRAVRKAL